MIEEIDSETYLFISKYKFQIFLFDKRKLKNLYNKELSLDNEFNFHDVSNLLKFLDENIFKIEKLVGYFIKDIILIIEKDENLIIDMGIKKKNYGNSINQKYLENSLSELKDLFKESHQNQTIMHMIITNYIINGKNYSSFINDLISDHLCLEVNFITISNDLIILFEKVLEKFQIKINYYVCGNYLKKFFKDDNAELSEMAYKLKNGENHNEVAVVPKIIENKGFFEKFFQLFS
jgi:hypothetical protein